MLLLGQGLAALLVQGLSGCAVEQIARLSPEWITAMGLSQSLTPSRNNGFLNMFLLMQKKALALLVGAGKDTVWPRAQSCEKHSLLLDVPGRPGQCAMYCLVVMFGFC